MTQPSRSLISCLGKVRFVTAVTMSIVCASSFGSGPADQGNGTYKNPLLFADYSDPDVIRVKNDFYMVASSFHYVPGIPILKSHDLVNWTIIGHVVSRMEMDPAYDMVNGNRYGGGVWAPAIRYHDGKFFVFFPTPNEGIFMSTAKSPSGPWSKPKAVIAQGGLEDPCPLWDDDGSAYLVHSRLGAGPLVLHKMSPDGSSVLDEGKVIVEDSKALPVLEGPKFYKRNGYYYIFAPYGGVETGSQAVLRAKNIYGPYEHRTVLVQGGTSVQGPHQGGYVETPNGEGWFIHFHSEGAYGRIAYLEPVKWVDDWPIIGKPIAGTTAGEPVDTWVKPNVGRQFRVQVPQTSDDFSKPTLSPQWEWNHNPDDAHWSLSARPGFLRLMAMPASDLVHARNTLTEMMQDPAFDLTVRLDLKGMQNGQNVGLTMLSDQASGIGLIQVSGRTILSSFSPTGDTEGLRIDQSTIQLRVHVEPQTASFWYSLDEGRTFSAYGEATPITFSWWKATRPAIYCFNADSSQKDLGFVDIDWVHYERAAKK